MIIFFKNLRGNPKVCALTALTGPFNLFIPFAAMYMFALGLSDVEIGIVLSTALFANFVMALLGGIIVDKLGRKNTLILSDLLAWNVATLIWAFAQNFWWFFVAAIFNSFSQVAMVAFECLWLDDLEERKIFKLTTIFHIFGLCTVFLVLISGAFIERFEMAHAMRMVYLFAFSIFTVRLVLFTLFMKETKRGESRMAEVKNQSVFLLLSGYKEIFLLIVRSRSMKRVLILMPMVVIFQTIGNNFFGLFITQNLGISPYFIAYFPSIRAVVALSFLLFIQSRLGRFDPKHLMGVGLIVYITAHMLLLFAPPQNMSWLITYALLDACAAALFLPRMDTLLFGSIDPTERARCRSLINVVVLAVSSPFGFLAGFLSDMDRRLPFVLNIMLFCFMIYFVLSRTDRESPQPLP